MKVKLREAYDGTVHNTVIDVKPAEGRRLVDAHKAVRVARQRGRSGQFESGPASDAE